MMAMNNTAMRTRSAGRAMALLVLTALAGCVSAPPAPPPPAPRPAPPPPPPPPPPPAAAPKPILSWDVAPVSAGDWTYRQDADGTIALFGPPDSEATLAFRCHPQRHEIVVMRVGQPVADTVMTIRTSSGDVRWPAKPVKDGLGELDVIRPASDPGFDWIAFSRGRFAVEAQGYARLIVPAWAEVARVIEDCRG